MLRDGQIVRDETRLFDPQLDATSTPPDEPGWVVTLSTWAACREALRSRQHRVGIQVQPDDDIAGLSPADTGSRHVDPSGIAFIAIVFPLYTDGRGFSIAQRLRHEYGWHGEMRAVGDVLIDTVHYLARCGFDCFVLKEGHDPQKALQAVSTFTRAYQRSYAVVSDRRPLS
jgi:uncharacterized protein (DUF934 family)